MLVSRSVNSAPGGVEKITLIRRNSARNSGGNGSSSFRAAPLGAVGSERVSSAFYSFSPRMVAAHMD
ncbi:helix-turn-helix domain-containing protein, partial [Streptomyces mirabilis]